MLGRLMVRVFLSRAYVIYAPLWARASSIGGDRAT